MKKLIVLLGALLMAQAAFSQEGKTGWQVELKKLAFDLTNTEAKHAKDYEDFANDRLNSDSETTIRGAWDSIADYHATHFVWTNQLLMDYGRTKIRPVNGESLTNENADQILVQTGYTHRLWRTDEFLGGFEMGPFANIGYETEFTKNSPAPRARILRGTGGIKLFDGKYLKKFYVAVVGERDFTYSPYASKLAWETALELEVPLREGVTFKTGALFRDYLDSTKTHPTDLDWEFTADARLDVQLYKDLYVAPFISYYTAQGKYVGPRGENVYVGVSFSFSHIFHEAK